MHISQPRSPTDFPLPDGLHLVSYWRRLTRTEFACLYIRLYTHYAHMCACDTMRIVTCIIIIDRDACRVSRLRKRMREKERESTERFSCFARIFVALRSSLDDRSLRTPDMCSFEPVRFDSSVRYVRAVDRACLIAIRHSLSHDCLLHSGKSARSHSKM